MPRLPSLLVVALAAIAVYASVMIPSHGVDPELQARTARLRDLTERHLGAVLLETAGVDADAEGMRRTFFRSVDDLLVPGTSSPRVPLAAAASVTRRVDSTLRGQLVEQREAMEGLGILADRLLATPRTDPEYGTRVQAFVNASELLRDRAARTAQGIEARSSSDAAEVFRWQAGIGLAVGVLGVMVTRHLHRVNRALANEVVVRQSAEDALRASERRSRLVIETAGEGFISMDTDGLIVDWNAEAENLFGWKRAEVLGKPLAEFLIPGRFREAHLAGVRRFLETGEGPFINQQIEVTAVHAEGHEILIGVTLWALKDEGTYRFNALVHDAGPRRRAERMFQDLLEAAPDAIVILDTERHIVLANSQTENLFRYSKEDLLGGSVEMLVPDLVGGNALIDNGDVAAKTAQRPHGIGFDLYGKKSDGTEFPVEISFGPIQTERGVLVTTIIRDISDRKRREELEREKVRLETEIGVRRRAEGALRLQRERARKYLDVARVMIAVVDADEMVSLINAKGCEVLGYEEDEVIGRNWFDIFVPARDRDLARACFREVMAEHAAVEEQVESRIVTKAGEERLIAWRTTVLTDDEGRTCARLSSGEDITERRRNEEALQRTSLELSQSNRELEQFAYAASHDLQEPLRMVANYTKLLSQRYRGQLDQDADDFIDFAVDGATRMRAFIEGLLEYSRLGKRDGAGTQADCETECDMAIENLRRAIEETGAVVTRDVLPTVSGEPTLLLQLFQNLISNAIKFHGDTPPRIHVSAKPNMAWWLFSVRDNGIGIDPIHAERIFAIFQRLHTAAEYPGTGIGLAICRKIVENHGGRIWVESAPGQGSTFHFTIPRRSA